MPVRNWPRKKILFDNLHEPENVNIYSIRWKDCGRFLRSVQLQSYHGCSTQHMASEGELAREKRSNVLDLSFLPCAMRTAAGVALCRLISSYECSLVLTITNWRCWAVPVFKQRCFQFTLSNMSLRLSFLYPALTTSNLSLLWCL